MTVPTRQMTTSGSRVATPHTDVDRVSHQSATSTVSSARSIVDQTPGFDVDWIMNSIMSPIAIVDHEFRLVAVNDAYCAAGGRTRSQLLGVILFDAFPENPNDNQDTGPADLRKSLQRVLCDGTVEAMPLQRYDVQEVVDGPFTQRFWSITTSPVRRRPEGPIEFALVHAEEVTSYIDDRLRREAAGELPPTAGQTDAVDTVFTAALHHVAALNDFAATLVNASTVPEIAQAFTHTGIDLVGGSGGAFVSQVGDRLAIIQKLNVDGSATAVEWNNFAVTPGVEPFSDSILQRRSLLFHSRAEFLAAYPSLRDEINTTNHHAWAVLPLFDGMTPLGALGITFDEPDVFSTAVRLDLQTLTTLTTQATSRALLLAEQAEAIDSISRILEADLDTPATVVTSTLYRPAVKLSRSGGDWFDVIAISDTHTILAIGDIAAHGAGTTGEMMRARSTLQSHALHQRVTNDIACSVSETLYRFTDTFATACVVSYDAEQNMITWTTAGHPYPLLITACGDVELLEETHGPPLGVHNQTYRYGLSSRHVSPGDTLVLYTDGLIERRREDLQKGFTRIVAAARSVPPNADLAQHLYQTLLPTGVHLDDVAILVARFVNPAEADQPSTTRSRTPALGHTPGQQHVDELGR